MPDEGLWGARNIAEYAYCQRLFYFMGVEGVFLPSEDTERGLAVHRKVDRPSAATGAASEGPTTVRSLVLSSPEMQLTATIDLAELDGQVAVPVEYRKGRPRRVNLVPPPADAEDAEQPQLANVEPWPTDRVQLGLQALLLIEAGYTVREAVVYYAAERRRISLKVDDELLGEARRTLAAAKEAAASEQRPPPLINDPRCVACSLQPLCLPDEVVQERDGAEAEFSPRRIWPPRDDGIHIVAQTEGYKIGIRGLTLRVTGKDGTAVKEFPIVGVESLSLLGGVQISTQALQALADRGVPVAFLSAAGRMIGMLDPLDSVSALVRRAQVRRFDNREDALCVARALIVAKVTNQRTMLIRNHPNLPRHVAPALAELSRRAAVAEDIEELRGLEGQAAAIYFRHFGQLFRSDVGVEFDANGRLRRPPPDPVNACLSMAYSMLTHECTAALRLARLEPSIGTLHVSRPGRPALALDLMEPFRPLVADSVAVSAFNRGELTAGHFIRTTAGCSMTDQGRRAFFSAYGRRMDTDITHPVFGYRLSYRRMLTLHARMLAAWAVGDVQTLAFLTTR